jgi:hypothetical protein
MKSTDRQLLLAISVFLLLFTGSWPFYQYVFDVDGVGYASIAEQYAAGQWREAVNGYWSPLHSWLVIPFLKAGIAAVSAFKITNALFAIGILLLFQKLLTRYQVTDKLQLPALLTAVVMLLCYVWYELAADLLLALLLLLYFHITGSDDFFTSRKKNLAAGVVGALAYLAKAYAFPFFLFHFLVLHLVVNRRNRQWAQVTAGILAFLLVSLPWIILLFFKYNTWMTGTSGKLNMSWYLVPVRNTTLVFFPPPHSLASSWWEDPWYTQERFYTMFSSASLFLHQLRVALYNTQEWLKILFQLSVLAPAVIFLLTIRFLKHAAQKEAFWLLLLLGLPAGYLLIHIEERFLWVTGFYLLPVCILTIEPYLAQLQLSPAKQRFIWLLFFCSFLLEPVNQLKDAAGKQKEVYEFAHSLKEEGLKGTFASNTSIETCMIAAYLNKLVYYTPVPGKQTAAGYAMAARRNGINHFLFFYDSELERQAFLSAETLQKAAQVKEIQPGVIWIRF